MVNPSKGGIIFVWKPTGDQKVGPHNVCNLLEGAYIHMNIAVTLIIMNIWIVGTIHILLSIILFLVNMNMWDYLFFEENSRSHPALSPVQYKFMDFDGNMTLSWETLWFCNVFYHMTNLCSKDHILYSTISQCVHKQWQSMTIWQRKLLLGISSLCYWHALLAPMSWSLSRLCNSTSVERKIRHSLTKSSTSNATTRNQTRQSTWIPRCQWWGSFSTGSQMVRSMIGWRRQNKNTRRHWGNGQPQWQGLHQWIQLIVNSTFRLIFVRYPWLLIELLICIEHAVSFAQPILNLICEYMGMKVSLFIGNPEPADGGCINIIK